MYNYLRRIDCFLGKTAVILMRLLNVKPLESNIGVNIKKILCIKLWGFGNLVVIYPLLNKLKDKFPESELMFMTFSMNKGFLENNQAVGRIFYFEPSLNLFCILKQVFKFIRLFKKEGVDLLINFETFNISSALFAYLIKPPIRIGLDSKYEGVFYTHSVHNDTNEHISKIFSNLLKPLGINSSYRYSGFQGTSSDKMKIENTLVSLGVKDYICIHPGTSENYKDKRYHKDCFVALTNLITSNNSYPVLFTGTKNEKDLIREIIGKCSDKNKVFDLSGNLTIWEFIELIRKCRLFISNDSGPVHAAASLGVNIGVFFGPTTPKRHGPLNENSLVFYKNTNCSPCVGANYLNGNCAYGHKCLGFSPQEAYSRISEKFLND